MAKLDFDLSGVKIPKRVAGIKVPKTLRKQGKTLLAKAQTAQGREAIAAGLTIAGAAIAAGVKAKAAKRQAASSDTTQSGEGAPHPHTPVSGEGTGPSVQLRTPGKPGTDPVRDPVGDIVAAGIGALQTFLAGRKA